VVRNSYKRVVVKVGTNVLTTEAGLLDGAVVRSLVRQIAELRRGGIQVVLVSSGAMGAGRALVKPSARLGVVARRQVLAAVGQVRLIETYARQFHRSGIVCAQVLATKEDFRDRHHYLNMRACFQALLAQGIVPVVNENDVVAVDELMFSDNDELAALIASMLEVDALILLTNVDGVYDRDPAEAGARVLDRLPAERSAWARFIQPRKSAFGRGGMLTKCLNAHLLSQAGIATHICHGRAPQVLIRLLRGAQVGTTIERARRRLKSKKRWMAGGAIRTAGRVTINEGARLALTAGTRVASLLPVGILAVEGEFDRGDLIRIIGERGQEVGLGVASYGAARARKAAGRRGERALVHYNQLYLAGS
jgi:glutamate 5-kinase